MYKVMLYKLSPSLLGNFNSLVGFLSFLSFTILALNLYIYLSINP